MSPISGTSQTKNIDNGEGAVGEKLDGFYSVPPNPVTFSVIDCFPLSTNEKKEFILDGI